MNPRDWFLSDADLASMFAALRGQARAAAADAVNGAADALAEQIPTLGVLLRNELSSTIRLARIEGDQVVDEEKAHAIRVLAEVTPDLKRTVNEIAAAAGVGASGGAIDEFNRRGLSFGASATPWVIGAALLLTAVAVAGGVVLAQSANRREGVRQ